MARRAVRLAIEGRMTTHHHQNHHSHGTCAHHPADLHAGTDAQLDTQGDPPRTDPVCGMTVKPTTAHRVLHDGQEFLF
jgi:hypothetical protein